MKFGKVLQIQSNPAWEGNYVQYKRLKRIIARVAFLEKEQERKSARDRKRLQDREERRSQLTATETTPLSHSTSADYGSGSGNGGGNGDSRPTSRGSSPHPDEVKSKAKAAQRQAELEAGQREFKDLLFSDLDTVNKFYTAQSAALKVRLSQLSEELQPWRHRAHATKHEGRFADLLVLYEEMCELRLYVSVNFDGFRKIVKKYVKSTKDDFYDEWCARLKKEHFAQNVELKTLFASIEPLCSREKLVEVETALRLRRSEEGLQARPELFHAMDTRKVALSVLLFVFILCLPWLGIRMFPDDAGGVRAHNCLALLVFATCMWMGQAVPFFATGLLIPLLVVVLGVLENPEHNGDPSAPSLDAKTAASHVSSGMFDHTSMLILGGFSVSAAFCKCQIEYRIASWFQKRLGKQPRLFMLAIMFLGLFLSMWIGNHTAPILCVSFLLPILHDLPENCRYGKALLLGLAFACNLGGMMTPIASLQNVLAVSNLEKAGYDITFGAWMVAAVPFCCVGVLLCWVFLLVVLQPDDAECIPVIPYDKRPITRETYIVLGLSLATIVLWATMSLTSSVLGDTSIVAFAFMSIMFGTGILTTLDFDSFNWNLLVLIGGGAILGDAVSSSGLLNMISHYVSPLILSSSLTWMSFKMVAMVTVISSFMSHTVTSIILMPLLVHIGVKAGHPVLLTTLSAFSISAAMALPFSSFPNVNSLLVQNERGMPYLSVPDFLKTGLPLTVVIVLMLLTLGRLLIVLAIGS